MAHPVQLVRFKVPSSAAEPMEIEVAHSGLRMVLVYRDSISLLSDDWKCLGVYFLLGPSDDPDRFEAYVGEVGKSTLVQRVRHHAMKKDWWSRALLIASDSQHGLNSAEIGWLEGRLYDVLHNAVACDVQNGNRPGDESLSASERLVLEKYVEPITAALRACGAPPDTADQKPAPKGKTPKKYTETLADLIAANLLKPGTVLQPARKTVSATATVLDDGRLLVNGEPHTTPSGAAKAAAGTAAEPGWNFWQVPSGSGGLVELDVLRRRLRENGPKKSGVDKTPVVVAPAAPDAEEIATGAPTKGAAAQSALAKIVAAAPERFPLKIVAHYQGQTVEATIEAPGVVHFDRAVFKSLSTAANEARKSVGYTGAGRVATNGWTFWRFVDDDGAEKTLDVLRLTVDIT
jgi:Restriction Enzyme Adenine Methylase Associated